MSWDPIDIAAFLALLTLLLSFVRVWLGPSAEDRLLGVLSFGTVGTAILCLFSLTSGLQWLLDVALVLALLSAVSSLAFSQVLHQRGGRR